MERHEPEAQLSRKCWMETEPASGIWLVGRRCVLSRADIEKMGPWFRQALCLDAANPFMLINHQPDAYCTKHTCALLPDQIHKQAVLRSLNTVLRTWTHELGQNQNPVSVSSMLDKLL